MKFVLLFLALLLAAPVYAAAPTSTPRLIGHYDYWRAYQSSENGGPVCYMVLTAHFPKNKKAPRGDALLTITHRPAENSTDVVSYTAGYNFKPVSEVTLHLGKTTFSMFTAQNAAWSRDAATDHKIAAALQMAPSIIIAGVPSRPAIRLTTDRFPLKGAAAAYAAIGKACGIEAARPVKKTGKKAH